MNPRSLRLAALRAGTLAGAISAPAHAITTYALSIQGALIRFDTSNPTASTFVGAITGAGGVASSYKGIDFRTSTGELYLIEEGDVTTSVYTLNTSNAVATFKSSFSTALSGNHYGMDFNPVADRLRTTSASGQNLRTNADTGATTVDTPLAYAAGDANFGADPFIVGSAYTNAAFGSPNGTGSTLLYNIDARNDVLVRQGSPSPNDGALTTIGALGFDTHAETGFDIFFDGVNNHAFASFTPPPSLDGFPHSGLFQIDLASGFANYIGAIGGGVITRDIALVPAPGAGAAALLAVGGAGAFPRRRRP